MSPLLSDPSILKIVPSTFSKNCDGNISFSRLAIRFRVLDLPRFNPILLGPGSLMPEFGVINLLIVESEGINWLIGKSEGISGLVGKSEGINWLIGKSVLISRLIGEHEGINWLFSSTPLILRKRELKIQWGQRLKGIRL